MNQGTILPIIIMNQNQCTQIFLFYQPLDKIMHHPTSSLQNQWKRFKPQSATFSKQWRHFKNSSNGARARDVFIRYFLSFLSQVSTQSTRIDSDNFNHRSPCNQKNIRLFDSMKADEEHTEIVHLANILKTS